MIAILTGDIVASRSMPEKRPWLNRLNEIVERKTGLSKPPKWGIFRGDGFQVELPRPVDALRVALLIRSGLKSVPELFQNGIDARIGIGIGEKGYTSKSVNESDGEAYQSSGNALDSLKSDQSKLQLRSPWSQTDDSMNIALQLASAIIGDWTQAEAEVVFLWLSEDKTQVEMAKKLKITQPAIHKRAAGAHLKEISDLLDYYARTILNNSLEYKK